MTEYKIKKVKVTPDISNEELYKNTKCYFGVSMNNNFFWDKGKLKALLLWINEHFDECLIIVGDYINRINEQIFKNISEEEAISESLLKGDKFISHLQLMMHHIPNHSISFVRWKEIFENLNASVTKENLLKTLNTNNNFNKSIHYSATKYINRKINNGFDLNLDYEEAIRMSTNYIIEEIACFNQLVSKGWTVEVYPGQQLRVLSQITKGNISEGMPTNLKKRKFVQVRVRKRKSEKMK